MRMNIRDEARTQVSERKLYPILTSLDGMVSLVKMAPFPFFLIFYYFCSQKARIEVMLYNL